MILKRTSKRKWIQRNKKIFKTSKYKSTEHTEDFLQPSRYNKQKKYISYQKNFIKLLMHLLYSSICKIMVYNESGELPLKYTSKKWVEVNYDERGKHNTNSQTKIKVTTLKLNLSGYRYISVCVRGIMRLLQIILVKVLPLC